MLPTVQNPKLGQWYLSVTCRLCKCKLLLFHDLNNGKGSIAAIVNVMCPRCQQQQELPVEHYQHQDSGAGVPCLPVGP